MKARRTFCAPRTPVILVMRRTPVFTAAKGLKEMRGENNGPRNDNPMLTNEAHWLRLFWRIGGAYSLAIDFVSKYLGPHCRAERLRRITAG
jgi:hypothetical protein